MPSLPKAAPRPVSTPICAIPPRTVATPRSGSSPFAPLGTIQEPNGPGGIRGPCPYTAIRSCCGAIAAELSSASREIRMVLNAKYWYNAFRWEARRNSRFSKSRPSTRLPMLLEGRPNEASAPSISASRCARCCVPGVITIGFGASLSRRGHHVAASRCPGSARPSTQPKSSQRCD